MLTLTRRPKWLNKKIDLRDCYDMKKFLAGMGLNTVCQQASCPNISECFGKGAATFLLLGKNCTRNCSFCNVESLAPFPVDNQEPERVNEAVRRLGLKHVVITSVTRDDLYDGGAGQFAKTIELIKLEQPAVTIEVLVPDFKGYRELVGIVVEEMPDIFGHNIETVPRIYKLVRPQADYIRSLKVLEAAKSKAADKKVFTKSGIMLGLGEKEEEVLTVFRDLRNSGCDFLSIGQYLAPSKRHFAVCDFIEPEKFVYYKQKALDIGFIHVESGPYVRSSYNAGEYLKNKVIKGVLI
ncbi:MAG: lipoyl synthase [Candidatus Omnitrophota bacterium]